MQVDLSKLTNPGDVIAVALSGGSDSMALLIYMLSVAKKFNIKIIALNVEHGIRGDQSLSDTNFVKDYCNKKRVPLLAYSVDALKVAKNKKLSIEQAARLLRYECFYDAIINKKCDKVATAHHLNDNVESILFNLFRGTGVKGASGIAENFQDKIIRPFLNVEKNDIDCYVKDNNIPFVTDRTNFCTDYTRNALRLEVVPQITKIFPKAQISIARFSDILKSEDDYMQTESKKAVTFDGKKAMICLPVHPAIFARATVIALKSLGIEKDYEKSHIDAVFSLTTKQSGASISLPQNVIAIKEYDKIVFYINDKVSHVYIPFNIGEFNLDKQTIKIVKLPSAPENLKDGLYADRDKIPNTAVIRFRADGDLFTKFGGGTKPLAEYFSDIKIPLRTRNFVPILADGHNVLAIFGVAISDKIKVDGNTKTYLSLGNIISYDK